MTLSRLVLQTRVAVPRHRPDCRNGRERAADGGLLSLSSPPALGGCEVRMMPPSTALRAAGPGACGAVAVVNAPRHIQKYRGQGACFKPPGVLHTRSPQATTGATTWVRTSVRR